MKRTKKFLVGLLATLSVLLGSLGLAACGGNDSSSSVNSSNSSNVEQGSDSNVSSDDENSSDEDGSNDEGIENFSQGLEYTLLENDTYEVMSIGDCTDTEIIIPSSYNGKAVTSIGNTAFAYCDSLTSIVIPDSVTSISESAFVNCKNLTYNVKDNLNYLGNERNPYLYLVGVNDTSITSATIENTCKIVRNVALFYNCSNLTYNVKDNLKYLGNERNPYLYLTGVNDTSITSATIENTCKFIAAKAFQGCDSLTSITIPDSVTSSGAKAFYNCDSLTSVHISSIEAWCNISFGLTTDDPFQFASSNPLSIAKNLYLNNQFVTELKIPNTVTEIKDCAFIDCDSITSVVIPGSVTSIGDMSFMWCSNLTSVLIGDGVTTIVDSAFCMCNSLTSVIIPNTVMTVGRDAFVGCKSLQFNEYGNAKYLGNKTNAYFALIGLKNGEIDACTIHNDAKVIAGAAFSRCGELTSITIPDGVISIGNRAFENCTKLTSIIIPGSVTSIGNAAFLMCDNLTSITIPDSVTYIGDWVFENCARLTNITFNGTKAQWNAIEKGFDWRYNVPATKVVCSDGEVSL